MKQITISLPDDVAHRLEIRAAIDDLTLVQGVEQLLNHLYDHFSERSSSHETSVSSVPS